MKKIISFLLGCFVALNLSISAANAAANEVRVAYFLEWPSPNLEDMQKKAFAKALGVPVKWTNRYSIENPKIYLDSNITGTFHVIESAKKFKVKHLIIGSSSSVYGANKKFPFQEIDKTDSQISFYAATKKSIESLAHSYSSLWKMPITILRFCIIKDVFCRNCSCNNWNDYKKSF